jgi:purine-nucleoside phosphorylase
MPSVGLLQTEAANAIRARWSKTPSTGIILGTGLGDLVNDVHTDVEIPYAELPHWPQSTALSHRGRLVCGRIGNTTAVVMDGRSHLYEGYAIGQITLPVQVFAQLGVKQLIISNASGGVNPQYSSGDIMLLEDHLDLTGRCARTYETQPPVARPARRIDRYYDEGLIQQVMSIARCNSIPVQQGVYAALTGPNYETRAEYRMLRRLGADVVGMSTVPEAVTAASLGMRVLALSVVTNVATPDCPTKTNAVQVVADAQRAGDNLRLIVRAILE